MRIGLIAHHVAPISPPFAGGVEAATWYLGRWFADQGHDVTMFAPRGSQIPGVRVEPFSELELSQVAARDVSMAPQPFMAAHCAYQEVMLSLAERAGEFDVIHSHSLHYLPVLLAELVSAPQVLTLHCPPTPWLESALLARRTTWTDLSLVAVSQATRALWSESVSVDYVIANGIDLEDWREGPGGPDLVWSGRIVPEKAPHLAIDAARLTGQTIRLAGPIVDHDYWSEMIEPRLDASVRYVGHLEHRALAELVGHSRALVVTPMWAEPFCLTAAEAMAAGTPVAGISRGGLPEVVGAQGGVLTESESTTALADAIARAALLPRAGVRAHAVAALSLERTGRMHLELYESLLASHERIAGIPRRGMTPPATRR